MLIAERIRCERSARVLFDQLSFTLSSGELLQVIGHNGAGKSSLLRIVAGLLLPQQGHLNWHVESSELFYLGHALALKNDLSVRENLVDANYSETQWHSALNFWLLSDFVNQPCGQLSQGQRQRVALARLNLLSHAVWILDEPFAHLDAVATEQLKMLLEMHVMQKGAVLIATHQEIIFDNNKNNKTLFL